jgi:hypothetical protein
MEARPTWNTPLGCYQIGVKRQTHSARKHLKSNFVLVFTQLDVGRDERRTLVVTIWVKWCTEISCYSGIHDLHRLRVSPTVSKHYPQLFLRPRYPVCSAANQTDLEDHLGWMQPRLPKLPLCNHCVLILNISLISTWCPGPRKLLSGQVHPCHGPKIIFPPFQNKIYSHWGCFGTRFRKI